MKLQHLLIGLVAALAFALPAAAGEADLSWEHPTAYTDGAALPLANIAATEIYYGACNATKTAILVSSSPATISVPAPANSRVITNLPVGSWCFQARTRTTDAAMEPSVWTNVVFKDVVAPQLPGPPTNFRVVATTAYMAIRQQDRYVMVPVGTVPGDTACDARNGVIADGAAYYAVPTSVVTWYGNTQPAVVLATCS